MTAIPPSPATKRARWEESSGPIKDAACPSSVGFHSKYTEVLRNERRLRSCIQSSFQTHVLQRCGLVPHNVRHRLLQLQRKQTQEYSTIPASSVDHYYAKLWNYVSDPSSATLPCDDPVQGATRNNTCRDVVSNDKRDTFKKTSNHQRKLHLLQQVGAKALIKLIDAGRITNMARYHGKHHADTCNICCIRGGFLRGCNFCRNACHRHCVLTQKVKLLKDLPRPEEDFMCSKCTHNILSPFVVLPPLPVPPHPPPAPIRVASRSRVSSMTTVAASC